MQQKIVGSPLALIGTSCYMLNTTRLKPGTWDRRTCQAMLQQAGINYSDMYTTYIVHFSDVDPNNESRQTQRELVRRLIVETWGPFMLRWNIVFFGKNMKSKRWVSRKNRKELKADFLAIQKVVADLWEQLMELDSEDQPTNQRPPSRPNGFA